MYRYITIDSMYQSLKDLAILRSLNLSKSSKFCNFRKSSQNFVIAAVLGLRRVPWCHRNAHSVKERLLLSLKNGTNSLTFIMPDLQELHRTNEPKAERIHATRLGSDRLSARTGAAGCSRSRDTVIHSAGRYSEESRINNISVKSCEKLSNSISEQTPLMRKPGKTMFSKHKSPPFTTDLT